MAAAGTRTGTEGSVTFPAGMDAPSNMHIFEWRATFDREIFDDSNFDGADNWKTKIGGMLTTTGTVRATADRADPSDLWDFATMHAQPVALFVLQEGKDTGAAIVTITFSALITTVRTAVVKTDRVFYDISFEGTTVPVLTT